jgi:hypothetical protein
MSGVMTSTVGRQTAPMSPRRTSIRPTSARPTTAFRATTKAPALRSNALTGRGPTRAAGPARVRGTVASAEVPCDLDAAAGPMSDSTGDRIHAKGRPHSRERDSAQAGSRGYRLAEAMLERGWPVKRPRTLKPSGRTGTTYALLMSASARVSCCAMRRSTSSRASLAA